MKATRVIIIMCILIVAFYHVMFVLMNGFYLNGEEELVLFNDFRFNDAEFVSDYEATHRYPPFSMIYSYLAQALGMISIYWFHLVLFLLLGVNTFFIAKHIFGTDGGFLSVFIMMTTLQVVNYSRHIMLEFPLLVAFSAFLLFVIKSDQFEKTSFSLFAGVALVLMTLIKQTFIIYVIPVIGFIFIKEDHQ